MGFSYPTFLSLKFRTSITRSISEYSLPEKTEFELLDMWISTNSVARNQPVRFQREGAPPERESWRGWGVSRSFRNRSQAPGMCQERCRVPDYKQPRGLGEAGETDVTTGEVQGVPSGGEALRGPRGRGSGSPLLPLLWGWALALSMGTDRQKPLGLLKSSLLTRPQFLPEIGELKLLTHAFCPRERGGDSLHRKQQRWKLRPSHCTSSAWYTVLPHAPHLLPPPQTGILQEDTIVRTGPDCTRRLTRSLEGFLHPGGSRQRWFLYNLPWPHLQKTCVPPKWPRLTSQVTALTRKRACRAQVFFSDRNKGPAFSTTVQVARHKTNCRQHPRELRKQCREWKGKRCPRPPCSRNELV